MDAGLSFIMANHAKVKENDVVFDPFVGTGIINLFVTLMHRFCLYSSEGYSMFGVRD